MLRPPGPKCRAGFFAVQEQSKISPVPLNSGTAMG